MLGYLMNANQVFFPKPNPNTGNVEKFKDERGKQKKIGLW